MGLAKKRQDKSIDFSFLFRVLKAFYDVNPALYAYGFCAIVDISFTALHRKDVYVKSSMKVPTAVALANY